MKHRYIFLLSVLALIGGLYGTAMIPVTCLKVICFLIAICGFYGCGFVIHQAMERYSYQKYGPGSKSGGPAMTAVHKNVRQKDPLLIRFLGSKLFGFLFWTFIVAIILFIVWQFIQGRASFQLLP